MLAEDEDDQQEDGYILGKPMIKRYSGNRSRIGRSSGIRAWTTMERQILGNTPV
jgi:hypothetical protein